MRRWFLLAAICFLFAGYLFWSKHNSATSPVVETPVPVREDHEFYKSIRAGCTSEIKTLKMEDPYLRGLIELGSTFQAQMNYYQCNPVEKGDVVLYRYTWKELPVARLVAAVGGDRVELKKVSEGWEIWIDGKIHMGGKQRFVIGVPQTPPPLFNYLKANGGKILPQHVLVLASFPPGDRDSSVFSAVDVQDIIAKISL